MPRRRLWYCTKTLKREFAYQTFIETIAGNHSECELKAVMDFIHYGLFEASKEKDNKAFSGIPLFCFNKQWLIIRILFFSPFPLHHNRRPWRLLKVLSAQKNSLEVREFVKFLFETVFFVETIHTSVCLSEFLTTCVEWVRIRSDFHT